MYRISRILCVSVLSELYSGRIKRAISFTVIFSKSGKPQTQAESLGQTSPFLFQAPFMSSEDQVSSFLEGSIEVEASVFLKV